MSAATTLPALASIIDLPDGLHPGYPEELYHLRIPGVASKHLLDLVAQTPAHAKAHLDGAVQEDNEAFRFGRMFHCAVLEPERFDRIYLPRPGFGDCRKKENKAARDSWLLDHGCPPAVVAVPDDRDDWLKANTVSVEEIAQIKGLAQAVRIHPAVMGHLHRGHKELTFRWTDSETGVVCKGRADLFDEREGIVFDVKTCRSASPVEFARSCANYRYHVQDCWYRHGLTAASDCGLQLAFRFVAVEKDPPYAVAVYELDEEAVRHGRKLMRRDLETFARCLAADEWPSYPDTTQSLSLPGWALR